MHLGKLGNLKMISESFWREKRVFVTGHTGFKGGWLSLWLTKLGAKVKGFSLPAKTEPSFFNLTELNKTVDSELGDIRNFDSLKKSINNFSPEIIFHLAAQPLVRYSYLNPVETFQTNVLGTANLLESALSQDSIQSTIIITTDKCYENVEWEWGYRENDKIGGIDPYSASKGGAELAIKSYTNCFFNKGDDLFSLSPFLRLGIQFLITLIAWSQGLGIQLLDISPLGLNISEIFLPNFLSIFLTFIWLVGVSNSINWMDGIDGFVGIFSDIP